MSYRDDLEAAAARARALEVELARTRAEAEQQREENRRLLAELEGEGPGARQKQRAASQLRQLAAAGQQRRESLVARGRDEEALEDDAARREHALWFARASSRAGLTAGNAFTWLLSLVAGGLTALELVVQRAPRLWLVPGLGGALAVAFGLRALSRRLVRRAAARERRALAALPFVLAAPEGAFRSGGGGATWLVVDVQLAPGQELSRPGLIEDLASGLDLQSTVERRSERTYRLRSYLGPDVESDWWGNRRALLRFHRVLDAVIRPLHEVHPVKRVSFLLD